MVYDLRLTILNSILTMYTKALLRYISQSSLTEVRPSPGITTCI